MLIKGATVTSFEADAPGRRADILLHGSSIAAIAPSIDYAGATLIDARRMLAVPGFVDAHRHLWETSLRGTLPAATLADYLATVNGRWAPLFEPEDAYVGTLLGALGAIDAGVTTVFNWSHIASSPAHVEAVIQAMGDAQIRGVYGHGKGARPESRWPDDLREIHRRHFNSPDLLSLALATASPEFVGRDVARAHLRLARAEGAIVSMHAGLEGLGRRGEIGALAREGLLGPDVNLVHCNTLSPDEWKAVQDSGASATITPTAELLMGHGRPPISAARAAGVLPSIGVDVETSAPSDLWTQMRALYALQRGDALARIAAGDTTDSPMKPREMLRMGTVAGAAACRLGARVGALKVGREADILLLRTDDVATFPAAGDDDVLTVMGPRNVDTVFVAGKLLKRGGRLIDVDLARLRERAARSRERILNSGPASAVHSRGK